jgi:hypothetical protein
MYIYIHIHALYAFYARWFVFRNRGPLQKVCRGADTYVKSQVPPGAADGLFIYIHTYIHIYIYIYRERERGADVMHVSAETTHAQERYLTRAIMSGTYIM